MRISHKYKFVFIAVPKTASRTIRSILDEYSCVKYEYGQDDHKKNQHITTLEVKKELFANDIKKFNSYFKFAFVRNPWERMVSYYEFMCKQVHKTDSQKYDFVARNYTHYKQKCSLGFTKFIHEESVNQKTNFFGYDQYYRDEHGKNLLNFIGKVENLQEDFSIICNKIGIPQQQLPHKNPTKHKHYTEYYNEETKQIVAEKFAKDIEYFNYEFGE